MAFSRASIREAALAAEQSEPDTVQIHERSLPKADEGFPAVRSLYLMVPTLMKGSTMDALHPNHSTNEFPATSRRPPVAAKYLDGQSPTERSKEKRLRVLDWVYRWGWSSADIINTVSGQATKGYAAKMVRSGLLRETQTPSVHLKRFFTLTADGLAEIERHVAKLLPYPEIRPLKVRQELIRHQLFAQRLTIEHMKFGLVEKFFTERMYPELADKA
ncbi:MAG: hypothetical protein KKH74_09190, partial [Gammaproteobacteria bacterium]|nr:hypothetical protein [Gammaproteobacteria bacterium]MBU1732864.1 hypothetical protein [Gammaproteobacteria bacterium]MBU1891783.1 hypothetical protein [Gammaproteobacteria bacterium]